MKYTEEEIRQIEYKEGTLLIFITIMIYAIYSFITLK